MADSDSDVVILDSPPPHILAKRRSQASAGTLNATKRLRNAAGQATAVPPNQHSSTEEEVEFMGEQVQVSEKAKGKRPANALVQPKQEEDDVPVTEEELMDTALQLGLPDLSDAEIQQQMENAASSSSRKSPRLKILEAFLERRAEQAAEEAALSQQQQDAQLANSLSQQQVEHGSDHLPSSGQPAPPPAAAAVEEVVLDLTDEQDDEQLQQQDNLARQQQEHQQRASAAAAASGRRQNQQQQHARRQPRQPPPEQQQQPRQRQQQQQQRQCQPLRFDASADTVEQRRLRALRQQLSDMERLAITKQEQLVKPDNTKLARSLEELKDLGEQTKRPREATRHAEVLATLASYGARMLSDNLLHTSGRRPADLITALTQQYMLYPLAGPAIDWEGLGGDVGREGLWRSAPGVGTMLGPLEAKAKQRRVAQRRQREQLGPAVKPKEDVHEEAGETQETDRWVSDMRTVLAQHPRVMLLQLVVNHDQQHGFSQTVENIFALSFLVKDLWCRLIRDTEQGLIVEHIPKARRDELVTRQQQRAAAGGTAAAAAGSSGAAAREGVDSLHPRQFMMELDMALWRDMCAVVPRGQGLMPHRQPVTAAHAAGDAAAAAAAAAAGRRRQ